MSKRLNLIGQRFNRLLVTGDAEMDIRHQSRFVCICDCGKEHVAGGQELKRNKVQSCGCLRVEEGSRAGLLSRVHGHGETPTPTYSTWRHMKSRCTNPDDESYRWYGLKGVSVCERWLNFPDFLKDMGTRPKDMTLDRINPFGNYELANCRWADAETQSQNKRRNFKEEVCL